MPKHPKSREPNDADLRRDPMIGGSKGARSSGATAEELEELQGENTVEGDIGNDKNVSRGGRSPSRP